MTNTSSKTRPIVMGSNGMVSAGHPLASFAGARALQDGGNAIDAAVVASAVLAVVDPASSGVGGDLFCLYYSAKSGRLDNVNASGRAPLGVDPEKFRAGIPATGPCSLTIPGLVMAWDEALERHGSWSLERALQPAIDYAEEGFPVSPRLSTYFGRKASLLEQCEAARRTYFSSGVPNPGQRLRLPDFANSLRLIAKHGPSAFYQGELAEKMVRGLQAAGGLHTVDDFARHRSQWGKPLTANYRGFEIAVQPPVSMGVILLEQLKIVEGYALNDMAWDAGDRLHILIEAKKASFGDLEAYLSDPDFTQLPAGLLTSDFAARRRSLISEKATASYPPSELGKVSHTTYLTVADRDGNAVSWIQTVFDSFGSCWMAPGTGFLMNNRMHGFSSSAKHINCLEPGKRTAHTLLAPMLLQHGKPVLVLGTPGDYGQTQSNLQMITNFVDHGMDVQAMIEAPRWRSLQGLEVAIENRFPESCRANLQSRGHALQVLDSWSDLMGGAQAIRLDRSNGCYEGAADPRREGYAIGW
jgi:gamma-glutamyltranspeptidase / glutathione hydrolase